jgi:hypothetical protein
MIFDASVRLMPFGVKRKTAGRLRLRFDIQIAKGLRGINTSRRRNEYKLGGFQDGCHFFVPPFDEEF